MKKEYLWISLTILFIEGCSAAEATLLVECTGLEESRVIEEVGRTVREGIANEPDALLPANLEQYLSDRGVDIEAYQQTVEERLDQPWSERRGINYSDRNTTITLVRSPLNQLSEVVAERAIETQQDVIGSDISLPNLFGFAYQLIGHDWSIFFWEAISYLNVSSTDTIPNAAQLSKLLDQPAISLTISDTGGVKRYEVFEGGTISEYFYGTQSSIEDCPTSHDIPVEKYVLPPSDLDPEADSQTVCFWSRYRQITVDEIVSISNFAAQAMCRFDAYDPDIGVNYLLGRHQLQQGSRYTVKNLGFVSPIPFSEQEVHSIPELVRVDYFKFSE